MKHWSISGLHGGIAIFSKLSGQKLVEHEKEHTVDELTFVLLSCTATMAWQRLSSAGSVRVSLSEYFVCKKEGYYVLQVDERDRVALWHWGAFVCLP